MDYIGKETQIKVGDKVYKFSRVSRAIEQEFADWVWSQEPHPLDICAAKINSFPKEMQQLLINQAWADAKRRKFDISSPEVSQARASGLGYIKWLQLLLQEHHPGITDDEVYEMAMSYLGSTLADQIKLANPELSDEEVKAKVMEELASADSFQENR